MLPFDDIFSLVKPHCAASEAISDLTSTPAAIKIHADDLIPVATTLHAHPQLYFDMLSCITGIDNGPGADTMEVAYNFYSIPFNHHLMVKVSILRSNPEIDTLTKIYKTADWHERELYDMFGIHVKGHHDLRRILMPADWDGFPLRKDYKQQAYYRDIKLDY